MIMCVQEDSNRPDHEVVPMKMHFKRFIHNLDVDEVKLRYLGFTFFWLWMSLFMRGPYYLSPIVNSIPSHNAPTFAPLGILTIVSALTMLWFGTRVSITSPFCSHRKYRVSACLCVVVGTLLFALGASIENTGYIYSATGSAVAGIGTACIMIMWGEFFGSVGVKRASVYICLCMIISAVLFVFADLCVPIVHLITAVASPLFSMILMRLAAPDVVVWRDTGNIMTQPIVKKCNPLPRKLLLCSGLYGAISGLVFGSTLIFGKATNSPSGLIEALTSVIVSVLLLLGIVIFNNKIEQGLTYRPTIFVMAVGCILLPFSGEYGGRIANAIVSGGYMVFYALTWMIYSDIAYRREIAGHMVFSWGRIAGAIGYAVGMAISASCAAILGFDVFTSHFVALLTMSILVLTALFVLDEKDSLRGWGLLPQEEQGHPAQEGPRDISVVDPPSVQDKFANYGLTNREYEILGLLLKGRSLNRISEDLGIAYNTVNTHVANIYTKCGVHSRQELIDLWV